MIAQYGSREIAIGAAAALALVTYFHSDIRAIALPGTLGTVDDAVVRIGDQIPYILLDGSSLQTIERDGERVILMYALSADGAVREMYRELFTTLCDDWRGHLRRGEITSVETRYRRTGEEGAFYLYRDQCR